MATATEWLLDAPERRLVAPAIVVEWLIFGAWLAHVGVVSV